MGEYGIIFYKNSRKGGGGMYGIGQRVAHPMHGAGIFENVTEELLYGAART